MLFCIAQHVFVHCLRDCLICCIIFVFSTYQLYIEYETFCFYTQYSACLQGLKLREPPFFCCCCPGARTHGIFTLLWIKIRGERSSLSKLLTSFHSPFWIFTLFIPCSQNGQKWLFLFDLFLYPCAPMCCIFISSPHWLSLTVMHISYFKRRLSRVISSFKSLKRHKFTWFSHKIMPSLYFQPCKYIAFYIPAGWWGAIGLLAGEKKKDMKSELLILIYRDSLRNDLMCVDKDPDSPLTLYTLKVLKSNYTELHLHNSSRRI